MVVMVTNVTIGVLVAMFTSGTIFANITIITFATMVPKVTSVHWLLGLRQRASNVFRYANISYLFYMYTWQQTVLAF